MTKVPIYNLILLILTCNDCNVFLSERVQIFKTFSEILLNLQARFGFLPLVFPKCPAVWTTWSGGCRWRLWLTMIRGVNDDGGRPNYGGVLDRVRGGVDVRDILAVLSRLEGRSPVLNVLECIAIACFKLVR